MENSRDQVLQIRLSKMEKEVIIAKAELLNLTVSDYMRQCCIFNVITDKFSENLRNNSLKSKEIIK